MSTCGKFTYQSRRAAVLLVAFNRPRHTKEVIESLKRAHEFDSHEVFCVLQLGNSEVRKLIEDFLPREKIIYVTHRDTISTKAKINNNMFKGLSATFSSRNVEYVVVLEDDIVIAKDFLQYMREIQDRFCDDKNFRAVNAFSALENSRFIRGFDRGFVRLNYGVAWGWSINRSNYRSISRYWTGNEDEHWDSLFEIYLRSGFVINPLASRVVNIGFDELATHTKSDESNLGETMRLSIDYIDQNYSFHQRPLIEKRFLFPWRLDSYNLWMSRKVFIRANFFTWRLVAFLATIVVQLGARNDSGSFIHRVTRVSRATSRILLRKPLSQVEGN